MKLYCSACSKVFEPELPEGAVEVPCPECQTVIPVPENKVAPGVVIGDFLIEKSLSHGGMGEVFVARQLSLDRQVAFKVLQDRFVHDREYIDGFFREARAAAKITHPHIVQAYAVGEENGIYYFAMELIRGETFKQILKKQNVLEFSQAAKVIREIASALDVAWKEQKLVHQDIKPDNIMLDSNGFAKLADLGLAHSASANDSENNADEVLGTPQYISPEQLTGVPTDVRSDIYSLGATFYQFVTGRFPYVADTAEEMTRMHVAGNLTPPIEINPQLPEELNAIILKMMARNIEDRYQLPEELIRDLEAFQMNNSASRPVSKIAGRPGVLRPGAAKPLLSKPGMTAGAPKLAVPGAKPGLAKPALGGAKPGIAKPALGGAKPGIAKPVLGGAKPGIAKPALAGAKPGLAKPAVPPAGSAEEKPAEAPVPAEAAAPVVEPVPAEAAAPAVEPVPAEAAAPAEVPAAAPAADAVPAEAAVAEPAGVPADGDGISLAPSAKKEKKAAPAEGKEESAPEENKKKSRSRGRKEDDSEEKKKSPVLKILLLLLLLVLLLAGAAAGFYFAAKKDKLPASLKPWGEKLLAKVGQLTAPAGGEQAEKTEKTEAAPVKTDVPAPPPPKPVTRKAYMDTLLKLQSEYRNMEESKRMVWLEKADGILRKMDHPVTAEELNALTETWKLYSTADEYMRFVPAREKARKVLQAKLAAAEEAREKEAQEQLRSKEEKERLAAEQKQIESRLAEEQKEYQEKVNARFAKLKQELEPLNTGMIEAILSYENVRNDEAFDKIMDQVKYHSVPVDCDTPDERKAIGVFQNLMRYAPGAYKGYKEFIDRCATLSSRAGFEVRLNGRRTLIKLDGINPDGSIRYRTFSDQTGVLKLSKRELAVFKNRLGRSAGAQAVFYYSVLSRTMDDTIIRQAPNPFWRIVYQNYKKLLQK